MASTFGILETAKTGLSVSMENLKITGHNISNANTVGYTRQRIITSAKEKDNASYLLRPVINDQVGQGVEVLDIQQIRSAYLDDQFRDLNAGYKTSDSTTQALTYLQGLFNSELKKGEGLTGSIESFFSSLNDFTKDTSSNENRIAVQKSGQSLTQNFNLVYQEMQSLWEDQNDSVSNDAQEINSIAQKLAGLNEAIARFERRGETANDLRDDRNLLLDTLSGYANITYENNADNPSMVDVKIGGQDLVSGTNAKAIEISHDSAHESEINTAIQEIADANKSGADATASIEKLKGYIDITVSQDKKTITYNGVTLVDGSTSTEIQVAVKDDPYASNFYDKKNNLSLNGADLSISAGTIKGGSLYAHMNMITSSSSDQPGIPFYMDYLNSLVRDIAKNINDIHKTGYSYDTDKSTSINTSKTGIYFFDVKTDVDGAGKVTNEYYSKITAGNFSVSKDIIDSAWNIAGSSQQVSSEGGKMSSGNSEIAVKLYEDLAKNGYYGKLNGVVGHLSLALDTNKSLLDTKESLLNSVDTQRASVSGVSRDEEATNLIVYQQSYSACARVITAIDQMIDTMINNMGLVGR